MRPLVLLSLFALGCAAGASGGTCEDAIGYPITSDCTACLSSSCAMEISACYGGGWQASHLSGTCAPYTACLCRCAVRDATCTVSCAPDSSDACLSCQDALATCVAAHCADPCSATGVYDGGSTTD